MAASLKRVVDYKLLYDSLADPSNGMIQLATLTTRWPKDLATSIKLPRGLPEQWRAAADDKGYLDWERFSSALNKALEDDKPRLSKSGGSQTPPNHPGDDKLRRKGALAPRVRAEEIEMFLSNCKGAILAQALSRTRKEVYKCQMSLHQLESSAMAVPSRSSSDKDAQSMQAGTNGHVKVPLVNALSSVGQEKEELLKGMEVMEITRQWFNSRLEQLALEEKQPAKKLKAEELLAALDRRESQPVSETLKHIQEINSHLGKLAKEAPGLSLEQLKKQYQQQQQQQQQKIKSVASDPGPFLQNKIAGQRSGPVKASATVKMNFPAYSPASNVHIGQSRVSPPVRSSSMREVYSIRGEVAEGAPRPSTTHRTVSMSTQNLTDHRGHDSQGYYHHHHHHHQQQQQRTNKPRRSHSFNEMSMSSSGGGSLAPGGLSSSSTTSTSSTGTTSSSNTADYSSKMLSHAHGYNTYPLRETASLQTLPSSASYGGNANTNFHAKDGHPHKHGSSHASSHHQHGHTEQIRSSSVRNLPSASGYIATTTTVAATITGSSAVSQSGRPIFSQPISAATAARVESVDIPSPSTTIATNMRDLSSSYPGHSRGPPSRTTSGHTQHGGGRGENPKPSRRHLHKAVQEQSLRIKQLEAENAALTRERGHRGQQQRTSTAAAGHPVIKTSALQSVV